jgi:hypothetical protein
MRVEPLHRAAGGRPQITPAQGSGLHAPLLQPNEQVVSTCANEQPLDPQVPGDS